MVVRDPLVEDLLSESSYPQWVLDLELQFRFAATVTVNLLVELACPDNGPIVAQVQTIRPLHLISIVDLGKMYH